MDRFRILVADDEPAQLELLSGFLAKQGFETILAPGAAEALATEGEDPPDRMRSLGTAGAMGGELGEGKCGWCGAVR